MGYIKLEEVDNEEIHRGIEFALENAGEMINEGDLLYKNGSVSRAYTLYQLASEEVGKCHLLFRLLMDLKLGDKPNYKEINGEFTEHKVKSKSAMVFEKIALLVMLGNAAGTAEERKQRFFSHLELLDEEAGKVAELNNNKNNSLYVGVHDKKFVRPKDVITDEMAQHLRTNTMIRFKAGETLLKSFLGDIDKIVEALKGVDDKQVNEDTLGVFFKD